MIVRLKYTSWRRQRRTSSVTISPSPNLPPPPPTVAQCTRRTQRQGSTPAPPCGMSQKRKCWRCSSPYLGMNDRQVKKLIFNSGSTPTTLNVGWRKSILVWLTPTTTNGRVTFSLTILTKWRSKYFYLRFQLHSQDTNEGKQQVVNDYVILLCSLIDKAGSG